MSSQVAHALDWVRGAHLLVLVAIVVVMCLVVRLLVVQLVLDREGIAEAAGLDPLVRPEFVRPERLLVVGCKGVLEAVVLLGDGCHGNGGRGRVGEAKGGGREQSLFEGRGGTCPAQGCAVASVRVSSSAWLGRLKGVGGGAKR